MTSDQLAALAYADALVRDGQAHSPFGAALLTLATAYRALRVEHERLTDHIHQLQLDADKRILAGRALAAEAAEARHQYHQHMSEADMVASNLEDRCRDAEAEVARLTADLAGKEGTATRNGHLHRVLCDLRRYFKDVGDIPLRGRSLLMLLDELEAKK